MALISADDDEEEQQDHQGNDSPSAMTGIAKKPVPPDARSVFSAVVGAYVGQATINAAPVPSVTRMIGSMRAKSAAEPGASTAALLNKREPAARTPIAK